MLWIVVKRKYVFLKYFYFMFVTSWMILSVYFIENTQMWVPNLQQYSFRSGALAPLIITNTLSFFVLIEFDRVFEKKLCLIQNKISINKKNNYRLIAVSIISIVLLFLIDILPQNYFNSGAANRFYFLLGTSAVSIKFYGYILFFLPIFAIYAGKTNRNIGLIIFVLLYSAFLSLIGTKFGGLFQLIYILVLCYLIPNKHLFIEKHYKKVLLYAIMILALFLGYAFLQLTMEKGNVADAVENLMNRILNGQGDVWWGVYSKFKGTLHLDELVDELGAFNTLGLKQSEYNFGIYKLMNCIAPQFVIDGYAAQKARFAASTEASFYYYFGMSGCIILKMILSVILAFLVNALISACKRNRGSSAILYVWLMTHFTRIYAMSDFYLILCKSALLSVILLIILNKVIYVKERRI